jgi:hypothetical protein
MASILWWPKNRAGNACQGRQAAPPAGIPLDRASRIEKPATIELTPRCTRLWDHFFPVTLPQNGAGATLSNRAANGKLKPCWPTLPLQDAPSASIALKRRGRLC